MGREYCGYIADLLAPWGEVKARAMFGGYGLYRQGTIFAIIVEDTAYFEVGEANRADYEKAGSGPFTYEARGKTIALSYWQAPIEVLDDAERLCEWAEKAYQVALQPKPKKQKKRY